MERSQLVDEGPKVFSESVRTSSAVGISNLDFSGRNNGIWDCGSTFSASNMLSASSSSSHNQQSVAHAMQYHRFQDTFNPFSRHSLTASSFTAPRSPENRSMGFSFVTNTSQVPELLIPDCRRETEEHAISTLSDSDFQGLTTFTTTVSTTTSVEGEKLDIEKSSDSSSPTRPKRRPYSKLQLLHLEREFQLCMYPCRERRVWLSQVLNLTERQVKIWFQNRRTKLKRTMEREKRDNEQMQRDMASLAMKFYSAQ